MLKITQLTGKIVFMMLSKLLVASKKCLQASRHRVSIISYSAQIYLITVDFGKSSVAYGRRAKSITGTRSLSIPILTRRSASNVATAPPRLCPVAIHVYLY